MTKNKRFSLQDPSEKEEDFNSSKDLLSRKKKLLIFKGSATVHNALITKPRNIYSSSWHHTVHKPYKYGEYSTSVARDVASKVQWLPMLLQTSAPPSQTAPYPPVRSRRSEFSWYAYEASRSQFSSFKA